MSKDSLSNSGNIILDVYKWRKPLIIFTLIASILGVFIVMRKEANVTHSIANFMHENKGTRN